MIDVYAFFDACREAGLTGAEAMREYEREAAEAHEALIEELEERQLATAWQQDLIDAYRRER